MIVSSLYLEITRSCTLQCEHCLRGECRKEIMSPETIVNIFKDIKEIDFLLISGGEPLTAVRQIRTIIEIIKMNKIKVGKINIVTNATVLDKNAKSALRDLASVSNLNLFLSYDAFHHIELERLGLLRRRNENALILKEQFGAKDYASYETSPSNTLYPKGNALTLSDERLAEINEKYNTQYVVAKNPKLIHNYDSINEVNADFSWEYNTFYGVINVDVNGNVCASGQSFDIEDEEATEYNSNINDLGFLRASINHINYYRKITNETFKGTMFEALSYKPLIKVKNRKKNRKTN